MKWNTHTLAQLALYEYVGLFGFAMLLAGIIRIINPAWTDVISDGSVAVIGLLLLGWVIQSEWRVIQRGKAIRLSYSKKAIMTAGAITLVLIYALPILHFIPPFVATVLLGGYEFGSFLLRVVDEVFGGLYGWNWVNEIFIAIPWLLQFVITVEVVQWIRKKQQA